MVQVQVTPKRETNGLSAVTQGNPFEGATRVDTGNSGTLGGCVVLKFPIHSVNRFGAEPALDDSTHNAPPSEPLAQSVDDFIESLRIRNYSEATIRGRVSYLGSFVAWCDRQGVQCLNDIALAVLQDFQRHLYQLGE